MYINIGKSNIIKTKDIIGIFDKKILQESRDNRRIIYEIEKLEKERIKDENKKHNEIIEIKSVILLENNEPYENKYEISDISVSTLQKRLNINHTKDKN